MGASRERKGVVLAHQELGEADRVVRLLCEGEGRVDAVARGARASRRRFGAAIEPGTRLRVTLRQGRGVMPTLEEAEVLASPRRARADLDRLILLHHGCEVIGGLTERGSEVERELKLLEVWLDLLEGEVTPGHASRLAFEAKALTFAGLAPALVRCAVCGGALEDPARFDHDAGGALHAACGAGATVWAQDLAAIHHLRGLPLAETPRREAPAAALWLLTGFIEAWLRRPLRARALWEGLG